MATGKHVAYYRVSTAKQGRSGLGLDAQRKAVADHLNGGDWELVGEFTEKESGKAQDNRPKLIAALRQCRLTGATLIVAKLDRLSRNAAFLMTLRDAGVSFVCADMPDANTLTIGLMAVMAQHERELISQRTRDALAAAKVRGVKLGGHRGHVLPSHDAAKASAKVRTEQAQERATDVYSAIVEARGAGATSLRQIAAALIDKGIPTPRGGASWQAVQVKAVIDRIEGAKLA
ncbi:MAG: recombinase family protein [Hyphomicrobiales bacterium]|nr:MAG: recombinase family protein [Hyphomicrobiales bacterium]